MSIQLNQAKDNAQDWRNKFKHKEINIMQKVYHRI